jgi:RNA polymerase sigma-70 factor, ECF subfamily
MDRAQRLPWCALANSEATQRFYELVWPHRAVILRAARIQTGNFAEAEDLAQETLLKAFKGIDGLRRGTEPKAWLLTILRNTRIDRLRTAAGSAKHVSLEDLPTEPASSESKEHDGDANWRNPEEMLAVFSDAEVIEALQNVSEELRWTLLLVDVEGIDQNEAAEILGVPLGTVKSRVHRGRAALRQVLLPLARDRRLVRE